MIRHITTATARTFGALVGVAILVTVLTSGGVRADWVNLGGAEVAPNIAEIRVGQDGVHVQLEVFVGDIETFAALVPGEWLTASGRRVASDDSRLADFSVHGLIIRADGGEPLPVERVSAERRLRVDRSSPMAGRIDPYSGRTIPGPPKDPRVMFVELFYPFDGTRPERIQLSPPLDDTGAPAASIGMVVFHDAVPVIDFRFLSAPATLSLDWDDPWYSIFDNPNLNRHHRYPRMTYLYAEPYEIRHEALVRVRDALDLVDQTPNGAFLSSVDARSLADTTAQKIGGRTPLTIDGKPVIPDFDRHAFMRIGSRGLEFLQPGEDVNVNAGILGLIWSVPTDGLPKQAELEWNWFDQRVPNVAGYAVDAAGPFLFPLTQDDRLVTWTNHFKIDPYPEVAAVAAQAPDTGTPMIYALCATVVFGIGLIGIGILRRRRGSRKLVVSGGLLMVFALGAIPVAITQQANRLPKLPPEQITVLATDLLNNVYRAFDFRTEDQVYDRLALTLDGDVLEEVYLAQRESLRIERAGGADARVDTLETTSVEQIDGNDPDALRLRADWIVRGSVGHWGHIHRRTNRYEAEMSVLPVDGSWKIRDFDVLTQERLQ